MLQKTTESGVEQHQQRWDPESEVDEQKQRWDPACGVQQHQRWNIGSGVEQQQQRWNPESGVNGTAAEVGPREWSEWNIITGGTQLVEWTGRSRGGTQRVE